MTRRLVLLVALLVGCASAVHAQAITSYTLRVYNVGAAMPVSTTVLQATAVVCNQAAVTPPPTVLNPTRFAFDDTAVAGRACIWTDNGTGPLLSLPFSNVQLQATLTATNSAGTSVESAFSNSFTRPGVAPPVPTGVKVTP